MFIAALLIIGKKWKQLKCPLTDEWISKLGYIHTVEYYSVVKKNEVLTHTTTWINLKNIMLSKRINTKGHILYESIYIKNPQQAHSQRQKKD